MKRPSKKRKRVAFKRDWECPKCGNKMFDVPTDVGEFVCPTCPGRVEMKKVMSVPLVMFKGEGWTPNFHGAVKEK